MGSVRHVKRLVARAQHVRDGLVAHLVIRGEGSQGAATRYRGADLGALNAREPAESRFGTRRPGRATDLGHRFGLGDGEVLLDVWDARERPPSLPPLLSHG